MSGTRKGYLFGVCAYLCWGLFPIYWKLLRPSTALEILAHRIVWSCVAVAVIVAAMRGWRRIASLLRQPAKLALVVAAAVLIAVNWGTYIYGVNANHVVETSLGYFINPLGMVLLGVFVLREHLRRAQWVAVAIGGVAVVVLTVDYGRPPVIALILATSFGLYGLVKKQLAVPATDGLLLESGVLALPAAAYLGYLSAVGTSTAGHVSVGHTVLVVGSGVVTAIPLLLFAGATNRIELSAIGLLQYIAPILQLACGVLLYDEALPPLRLAGFGLVWLGLAVFSWDAISHIRTSAHTRTATASHPLPQAAGLPSS